MLIKEPKILLRQRGLIFNLDNIRESHNLNKNSVIKIIQLEETINSVNKEVQFHHRKAISS